MNKKKKNKNQKKGEGMLDEGMRKMKKKANEKKNKEGKSMN